MKKAIFVAGTDTDVGKTVVSQALLLALAQTGLATSGYKPVAAGSIETEQGMRNSDAEQLAKASSVKLDYNRVNPYPLKVPASPHFAAELENINIDFSVLSDNLAYQRNNADLVVVEGAGGWRVPVSEHDFLSSWVKSEKLPVVLVVGIKLGCLSHAMLTVEAIEADGLEIVGWVANRINPGTEYYAQIIHLLEQKIHAPKLGEIPYLSSSKRDRIHQYLDVSALM